MKKLLQGVAATALIVGASGGFALAQEQSCTISNTGPDSVNSCEFNEDHDVTITCDNDFRVTNDVDQEANSGLAVVEGNTSAWDAESGQVTNLNEIIIALSAVCGQGDEEVVTPPAVVTPAGGQGAAAPAPAPAPAPKVLPKTGVNATVQMVGVVAAVLAALTAVGHTALSIVRRRALEQ